jgi:hypothetical protein
MRSGPVLLAVLAALGAGALALTGVMRHGDRAGAAHAAAEWATVVAPGARVCGDADLSGRATAVRVPISVLGSRMARVTIEASGTSSTVSTAPGARLLTVPLRAPIEEGDRSLTVCLRADPPAQVVVYRGVAATELAFELVRERRSALAQLPDSFERAALFHPGWVGAWTFWVLTAAVLLGVPALLVRALRGARR